jgi:hypothetical protein
MLPERSSASWQGRRAPGAVRPMARRSPRTEPTGGPTGEPTQAWRCQACSFLDNTQLPSPKAMVRPCLVWCTGDSCKLRQPIQRDDTGATQRHELNAKARAKRPDA